jgi:hypothetical protein
MVHGASLWLDETRYILVVMLETFRQFEPGPDPFGRKWHVHFRWLQTATSIRHADTVDVKFGVSADGAPFEERVIALSLPVLLDLAHRSGVPLSDGWCLKLAALHLQHMIESGEDIEKTLVTTSAEELGLYASQLKKQGEARIAALS